MELDDVTSILANAAFFDICEPEQQRLLAFASEQRQSRAGEVISTQGDPADGAYIIMRGSVAISDDVQRALKSYGVSGPNVMIGELALVLDRPRRKTATAVTNVEALFVPRMAFVKLMRQFPDMAERAAARIENELGAYLGALDKFRPDRGQA